MEAIEDLVKQTQDFFVKVTTDLDIATDWPALCAFFVTLLVGSVTVFQILKILGLYGRAEPFWGVTKEIPGVKESETIFSVDLIVDSLHLRGVDSATKEEIWKLSFFSIKNWGFSDKLFQVIFTDSNKKVQTVNFVTTMGKEISESLQKKINLIQEKVQRLEKEEEHKPKNRSVPKEKGEENKEKPKPKQQPQQQQKKKGQPNQSNKKLTKRRGGKK